MAKLIRRENEECIFLIFYCPACKLCHSIRVFKNDENKGWRWNNDINNPTFYPSLLSYTSNQNSQKCHLFIENGKIRYLNDCTNKEYKNKIIDMEEV